ncbi:MAG: hypothetical protein IPL79_14860 [Myxococcales bacterium]|nr:hypothetical protein [Myxococcales bacterium]
MIISSTVGCLAAGGGTNESELPPGLSIHEGTVDKSGAARVWLEIDASAHAYLLRSRVSFDCPGVGQTTSCRVGEIELEAQLAPYLTEILRRIEAKTIVFDAVVTSGLTSSGGVLEPKFPSVVLTEAFRGLLANPESSWTGGSHGVGMRIDTGFQLDGTTYGCKALPNLPIPAVFVYGWSEAQAAFDAAEPPSTFLTSVTAEHASGYCIVTVHQAYEKITDAPPLAE